MNDDMTGLEAGEKKSVETFEGKKKFAGVRSIRRITGDLVYLGASDRRLDLFENVYPLSRGVSYNSYLLLDEKTVLFDTVDRAVAGQFFENLEHALGGRALDYFVIHHMEPDHCSAITEVLTRYPGVTLLYSRPAEAMLRQFFSFNPAQYGRSVAEGEELVTGRHRLVFMMAPLVHWPEVMMTYDAQDKVLFSADAFGTFGALNGNLFADEVPFETEWLPEARRYYANIVGKYGKQVQAVLAKAAKVDIRMICPLHGPIWRKNLNWYIGKYDTWSRYEAEDARGVMVVYGSIYGGTESAAAAVAAMLSEGGVADVRAYDVSRTDVSVLIGEAFRCSHIVLASVTYNADMFTPMKNFLHDLAAHGLRDRRYALIENGSWAPLAGRKMRELMDAMPGMEQVGETVTLRCAPDDGSYAALSALADALLVSLAGEAEKPL